MEERLSSMSTLAAGIFRKFDVPTGDVLSCRQFCRPRECCQLLSVIIYAQDLWIGFSYPTYSARGA